MQTFPDAPYLQSIRRSDISHEARSLADHLSRRRQRRAMKIKGHEKKKKRQRQTEGREKGAEGMKRGKEGLKREKMRLEMPKEWDG